MTNPAGVPSAAVSGAGQAPPAIPSFRGGLKVWLKIATLSFGGPAGQIAVMHRVLVEDRRWISESRFLHALNYCMLLPGPEAQQLVTYVPCFMFIFVGAPFIESLRRSTALRGALSAITAAVVGVVLNLAVWFSIHTLFGVVGEVRTLGMHILLPEWSTVDLGSLAIAAGAAVAMLRFRVGMLTVLAAAVLAGLAIHMAFGA